MSNGNVAKLENINKVLRFNSIFWCVGWLALMITMIGLNFVIDNTYPMLICWGIIGLPKILAGLKGGIGGALLGPLKADYAVVTVNSAGMVTSSDGGAESIQVGFIGRLIALFVMYLLGGIVQIVHLFILSIRYAATALSSKVKSSVIPNGFIIIIINVAVLIGGFAIGAVLQKVSVAAVITKSGYKTSGGFFYRINKTKTGSIEAGIVINDYESKKGGNIVIPATFEGLPVVAIIGGNPTPMYEKMAAFSEYGENGFGTKKERKERITSVVIPDTVTIIDDAFRQCTELKQITLPKNLKMISNSAFLGSGLTSIVIPEGVTDIGFGAFARCPNLTSVTLPRSLKRMADGAFGGCTSLVEVKIPSGLTIQYGSHTSKDEGTRIENMGINFVEKKTDTFKGSTKLSDDSRQAIRNTGYEGEF